MIKAIIFDAYGTLIDTKDGSVKATQSILRKNGSNLDPKEVYAVWKKYHAEHISQLLTFSKDEQIFLKDIKRLYCKFEIKGNAEEDINIMLQSQNGREAFPETADVIEKLKTKYKVYIGSNTDTEPLMLNLNRNNIVVEDCFTSELLQTYKPSRDFFTQILKRINCNTDEVVYVGDSQVDDILGAMSLNILTVWVNRKKQILQEGIPRPSFEITSLNEIFNFL